MLNVNRMKNGKAAVPRKRRSPGKATPEQQAARREYLELTRTRVTPERMAEIRAEWKR